MPFTLVINGQSRDFAALIPPASLEQVVAELNLKGDRVAIEHNGSIVQRVQWPHTTIASGDRLEVVHFVGGGSGDPRRGEGPNSTHEAAIWSLSALTIHNIRYQT
jgi:sulfur carrier protein